MVSITHILCVLHFLRNFYGICFYYISRENGCDFSYNVITLISYNLILPISIGVTSPALELACYYLHTTEADLSICIMHSAKAPVNIKLNKTDVGTPINPSAAFDPYIPTWLTTSPANHKPANFLLFFFTFKGNCEKWCNLRPNWWASTSNLKLPFCDSFKYK